ncbi:XRE family transcriptional regulator [Parabacteroides sp. 52]|uniref:helix-turn-helix transcriptional regulator n=1 Tax=unclassified Parabacteroides TaxID=2649774 RepID=UPI0013D2FD40|nr:MULTISPECIES: helix-turn-helix transcriptional regulator [unclassified Parabacteroides]MDH6533478.1 transcriptional regulator with XRE-family HTH domain [Parabacteroides sp. PM5-20]NDV54234.1 XRE family transcriptional regulator [Parabacteroides sp. 52]
MKDRIIKVMEREGMTSSKFAEAIGIQRAAMSHIISGRNNPSLDVISKILQRFPKIDSDWLLFGKGEMIRGKRGIEELDLFSTAALFSEESTSVPEYRKENELNPPPNWTKQANTEQVIIKEKPPKKITKIMVIYSDDSLETFIPEKSKKE